MFWLLQAVWRIRTPGSGIRDGQKNQNPDPGQTSGSGSGMNIPDYISESLETIFWVKNIGTSLMRMRIRNLFDPGSGIRDGKIGIRDKHPGSATLLTRCLKGRMISNPKLRFLMRLSLYRRRLFCRRRSSRGRGVERIPGSVNRLRCRYPSYRRRILNKKCLLLFLISRKKIF